MTHLFVYQDIVLNRNFIKIFIVQIPYSSSVESSKKGMPPGLLEPPDAPTADIPSGVENIRYWNYMSILERIKS
jgi:hypothetical protein